MATPKSRTLGPVEWAYREEALTSMRGVIDIGVGDDAMRVTGMGMNAIGELIQPHFRSLIDGGANNADLTCNGLVVRLYVRRRGRHVDIGTRLDFIALGWELVCDALDKERG